MNNYPIETRELPVAVEAIPREIEEEALIQSLKTRIKAELSTAAPTPELVSLAAKIVKENPSLEDAAYLIAMALASAYEELAGDIKDKGMDISVLAQLVESAIISAQATRQE